MQRLRIRSDRRRITAAVLKQLATDFLIEALPAGWICQPLSPTDPGMGAVASAAASPLSSRSQGAADILVISPRGRCHFLLVRAPADRWWDGGPKSVPAERVTEREARLMQCLRAAGHKTRPIWGERDLARALEAWGCPIRGPVHFGGSCLAGSPAPAPTPGVTQPARATLRLGSRRSPADA